MPSGAVSCGSCGSLCLMRGGSVWGNRRAIIHVTHRFGAIKNRGGSVWGNQKPISRHQRAVQREAIRGNQRPSEAIRRHQRSTAHLHEPRPHVNRIGRAHRSAAPKSHVDRMLACDGRQQSDAIRGNQTSSEVISGRYARLRRQVAVAPPSSLLRVGRRAAGAKPRTRSTAPGVMRW